MSRTTAQVAWQRSNTRQVGLRFNRNQDAAVIAFLEQSAESPTQLIRRLIREEITRTGWTPPAEVPRPASLSLDGGES